LSRRIRNKTQKGEKRNNSPLGELFWIHLTLPACMPWCTNSRTSSLS
jgi:hypothetical protein